MENFEPLKNIAGNDVSIFLFRFVLKNNGIDFVLNEMISEDMYPDLEEKLKPLVKVSGETLLRYRNLSISDTIMDGNILTTGEFEVMLSKGLGKYFNEEEKNNLFADAYKIQCILSEVMDRKTKEIKTGINTTSYQREIPINVNDESVKELADEKALKYQLLNLLENKPIRKGLKQLRPEDLPEGVFAERGYDHRGHCLEFKHKIYGPLGRITLIGISNGKTLVQSDFNIQDEKTTKERKKLFYEVIEIVNKMFSENFK